MKRGITEYVLSCDVCKQCKDEQVAYPGLLQPLEIPTQPWASISMDFIEGLPNSQGKTVIWVIIDRFTKYGHFLALQHPYTAEGLATLYMNHIHKLHGSPESIISDRDVVFQSEF